MKLHDLKLTKKDRADQKKRFAIDPMDREDYPWELELHLGPDVIKKISGMEKLNGGDRVCIKCEAVVKRTVTESITTDKKKKPDMETRVTLQIQKMGLEEPEDAFSKSFKSETEEDY